MQLRSLSSLLGMLCLVLAISGWLLRVFAFMHAQFSALTDAIPRMPQACEEMGEVLSYTSASYIIIWRERKVKNYV